MRAFAATRLELEILTLSEVSQTQIPREITCVWNLKSGTNEPVYRTDTEPQTWGTDVWSPRGREWDGRELRGE